MTDIKAKSSRRSFFLQGSAVLGAGIAATAGATALTSGAATPGGELQQLREQLGLVADREAIRRLHLAFTVGIESGRYEDVAELFDEQARLQLSGESATGMGAIRALLAQQYRSQQAGTLHSAYRQDARQQLDAVTISEDRQQAVARFHVDVELSTPLQGDSTLVRMSRLQGHMADRRWEAGRFEARYVKRAGQWKMTSLHYLPA